MSTLTYYNTNAQQFYTATVSVDLTANQDHFLSRLSQGASILDFGCGSGRDAKYFLSKGFYVDAIDGSEELCKLASAYAGIQVKHMLFQELSVADQYDGIWACSSILHLPAEELAKVMEKMSAALTSKGIIYTSFKYGTFSGERNGRFFTDMTEEACADFIGRIDSLAIEEQWVTFDARPGRGEEKWLNLILRKRQMQ